MDKFQKTRFTLALASCLYALTGAHALSQNPRYPFYAKTLTVLVDTHTLCTLRVHRDHYPYCLAIHDVDRKMKQNDVARLIKMGKYIVHEAKATRVGDRARRALLSLKNVRSFVIDNRLMLKEFDLRQMKSSNKLEIQGIDRTPYARSVREVIRVRKLPHLQLLS